jgi:hypothetical protein
MFWYLKKTTNTAEIFGSVSSILKHEKIENTTYNSKLYECFSRKKLDVYEDETYRIERKEPITATRKSKARVAQAKNKKITPTEPD